MPGIPNGEQIWVGTYALAVPLSTGVIYVYPIMYMDTTSIISESNTGLSPTHFDLNPQMPQNLKLTEPNPAAPIHAKTSLTEVMFP